METRCCKDLQIADSLCSMFSDPEFGGKSQTRGSAVPVNLDLPFLMRISPDAVNASPAHFLKVLIYILCTCQYLRFVMGQLPWIWDHFSLYGALAQHSNSLMTESRCSLSFSKRVAPRYGFLASTVCKRQWLPMAQVHQGHWPNMQSRHLPHRLGEICTKPSISLLFVYFCG